MKHKELTTNRVNAHLRARLKAYRRTITRLRKQLNCYQEKNANSL